MTHQLTFSTAHSMIMRGDFAHHLPAQAHSETSVAAAQAGASKAAADRVRVLNFLKARGIEGATDDEMQDALQLQGSTQRPRRISLCDSGLVADSGSKRNTKSGHPAVVWVVVE